VLEALERLDKLEDALEGLEILEDEKTSNSLEVELTEENEVTELDDGMVRMNYATTA
jgi:hypothetical protein